MLKIPSEAVAAHSTPFLSMAISLIKFELMEFESSVFCRSEVNFGFSGSNVARSIKLKPLVDANHNLLLILSLAIPLIVPPTIEWGSFISSWK